MNKEVFIEKIKDIKVNVPNEMFFIEYNKIIYDILDEKEKLIKYLESMLDGSIKDKFIVISVVDLLEKVKSGKYE